MTNTIKSLLLIVFSVIFFKPILANPQATLIDIQGGIGPATADFMIRSLNQAEQNGADLFVIRLDTPGGLDKSMRQMVKAMLASSIPVVTYVAPSGARAASAGTFILYASHVAAMAPGTNLGAASPVSMTGGTPSASDKKDDDKQDSTANKKVTNDAIAYIKSLAELSGRDVDFAMKAVSDAKSISAQSAKKNGVIEIIASDLTDLYQQLHQRKVTVANKHITLNTKDINTSDIKPDWRMKLLSVITDPSVAYILLLIGIYGLFFEFANPGFVLPGVAGAISMLLALYALQLLPISYAGLGLILLGIAFMVSEAFIPSFGALGIGGVVAFVAGSVLLMDASLPAYQIAWPLILSMALVNGLFFFFVVGLAARARQQRVVSGAEDLLGSEGIVVADGSEQGQARIKGELWYIECDMPLSKGTKVVVVSIDGLRLGVKPLPSNQQ